MGVFALYSQHMRRGNLSHEEIIKAEKAKDDRQRSRAKGFSKMRERDAGWGKLRDYARGSGVIMLWGFDHHADNSGVFKLVIDDGTREIEVVLNAEEIRRYLRWV